MWPDFIGHCGSPFLRAIVGRRLGAILGRGNFHVINRRSVAAEFLGPYIDVLLPLLVK
jgi:hypothetical protein